MCDCKLGLALNVSLVIKELVGFVSINLVCSMELQIS